MKKGFHRHKLELRQTASPGCTSAALPAGAAGSWCRLTVCLPGTALWWAKVEAREPERGHVVREAFLGRLRRMRDGLCRRTLVHIPAGAEQVTLRLFTPGTGVASASASLEVLTRFEAGLSLLGYGWRLLPSAVFGDPQGLLWRARAIIGQAPARQGEAPPYAAWQALYETWDERTHDLLSSRTGEPGITAIIIGTTPDRLAVTQASLIAQWVPPSQTIVIEHGKVPHWTVGAWVVVLQAGEVLAPQALACFADAARRNPDADGFYADLDQLIEGGRGNPLFKPRADAWLLRSGLLTQGACLFRARALQTDAMQNADALRLSTALALPEGRFCRIPFILTHVPPREAGRPVVAAIAGNRMPTVSIVIPTSGRARHVLRCLRRLLGGTRYPVLEVLLAVSHADPSDAQQAAHLASAARLKGVRVLDLGMNGFNYAEVNNLAVHQARGELVLLLNDDVVPLQPDWLHRLVAFLTAPADCRADIVGARLLYGNRRVQHGGVILGLGGLCEHAFRLASHRDAGPHGLALLSRKVSAVTGACLLLRRSNYEMLGGMDESFAVALNDVDFCLTAGRAGLHIVLAAEVEMLHYESLSLGRHYKGARAGLEAKEVRRLSERWASEIAADPFYNPSASLEPGREFHPSFPPRITPLSWSSGEAPVEG